MTPAPVADTACANAIFQQPWWLDAVAPGRWDQVVVERDGRTVARLPYSVQGRGRWRVLAQPPLTQTLGPWVERSSAKPARALANEMELLTELERQLPPAEVFSQEFSPTMLNALPFVWAGYRIEVRYTYRLEGLDDEETLWDGLRGNIRREIRKARRQLEVCEGLDLDLFYAVWAKTYKRQDVPIPHSLARLERLDAACAARGARTMLFARDDAGRVHSVTYVVEDENAAYYLLGGSDPELRTSGAASLLMWEAILRARGVTDVFDFTGSMLVTIERFFRAFGARQRPYLSVSRASRLGRTALLMRASQRRLAARYHSGRR